MKRLVLTGLVFVSCSFVAAEITVKRQFRAGVVKSISKKEKTVKVKTSAGHSYSLRQEDLLGSDGKVAPLQKLKVGSVVQFKTPPK